MKHSNDVIDAVLNHAPVGVTQRHYNHYEYMEEKVAAMKDIEELMTSLGL
jgi:integrase